MIESAAAALAALPLAEWMRSSAWAYPLIEIVHIVGLAVLVGSIFVVDLRLLGIGQAVPRQDLLRFVLPWTLASLLLVLPSGALLFIAHASDLAQNRALWVKLLLIALAGLNAAAFHRASRAPVSRVRERWTAASSMTIWISVIAAGRLIAYV